MYIYKEFLTKIRIDFIYKMCAWPHMKDLKTGAKKVMSEKSCFWYSEARGQAALHFSREKNYEKVPMYVRINKNKNWTFSPSERERRSFNRAEQISRENRIFRFCLYLPPCISAGRHVSFSHNDHKNLLKSKIVSEYFLKTI